MAHKRGRRRAMVSDSIRAYRFAVPRRIAAGAPVLPRARASRAFIFLETLAVAHRVLPDRGRRTLLI